MENPIMDVINAVIIWPMACVGVFTTISAIIGIFESREPKGSHYAAMRKNKNVAADDMFCCGASECESRRGVKK